MNWTQEEAVELCRKIEAMCPPFGCHVALTGGTLYKDGPRKDCDILFYRIRQQSSIDTVGLEDALLGMGIKITTGFLDEWCSKAIYQGKQIDIFMPETESGEYAESPPDHFLNEIP